MEQRMETVPVTPEEALYEVRFTYDPQLLREWSRRSVRPSRRVWRVIRIVLCSLVILYGAYQLWEGLTLLWWIGTEEYVREMYLSYYTWGEVLYLNLFYPLLLLALGVLWLLLDRIRIRRAVKQTRAMFGPEPWPVQYLLGEDRFTAVQCGAVQTIPYRRVNKVEQKQGFILLWMGNNIIRLPKSTFTKGTPEDLLAFLRERIPTKG